MKRFTSRWWFGCVALALAAIVLAAAAPPASGQPADSAPVTRAAVAPAATERPADIEIFVREGCPHCARAEAFLATLGRERPELRIVVRDVGRDAAALARLKERAQRG